MFLHWILVIVLVMMPFNTAGEGALTRRRSLIARQDPSMVSTPHGDFRLQQLDDGRQQLQLYVNGILQGSVVADENGAELIQEAPPPVESDGVMSIEQIQPGDILAAVYKIVSRLGLRVLSYAHCILVTEKGIECLDHFVDCAVNGTVPWLCIPGIHCTGGLVTKCWNVQ